jgi:uncharacterized protein (DUF1330 family)
MSVFAIAQSRIKDQAALDAYVALAVPTLHEHGVEVLVFDEAPKVVEGTIDRPRTVILKFDSEEAFYRWYDSPEYQAAKQLREGAADGTFILTNGLD